MVIASGTVAVDCPVTFARIGTTGGSVSFTITVWFAVLLLPFPSLKVQWTVKVPCVVYDSGSEVVPVTTPATASVVLATGTVAKHCPVTVASTGATGLVVSRTRTVKLPEVVALKRSVADTATEVSPIGNRLPLAGATAGISTPSSISFAETLNATWAPPGPVASAMTGEPGIERVGGALNAVPCNPMSNGALSGSLLEMCNTAVLSPMLVGANFTVKPVVP